MTMTKTWFSLLLVNLLTGCAVVAEYPVTSASIAVLAATGKGPADHALSSVAERDCATLRVLDGDKICRDHVIPQVVDISKSTIPQSQTVASSVDSISKTNNVFSQRAQKR